MNNFLKKYLPFASICLMMLFVIGCASKAPAPVEGKFETKQEKVEEVKPKIKCPDVYIVKENETLFSISLKCGFDYQEVARINGLKKPYKVKKGDEIRLDLVRNQEAQKVIEPAQEQKVETIPFEDETSLEPVETVEEFQGYGTPTEINEPKVIREVYNTKNLKETNKVVATRNKLSKTWSWPTNGSLGNKFDPNKGMKGIEIIGEAGQEIRSVAKGKVIYAGEDLKGYGRLVIIKHEDNLITVYGHTQEILVREGQSVEAAEAIATMGNSGTEQFKLLFEVRKGGQSVDPLRYLKQSS